MVLRLSELLERIRPAGTPGAPTEGELQRRDDRRAAEIETIRAILTSFEAEADAIIATARNETDQVRSRGHSRAHETAAAVPDRIAVAEAEAAHLLEQRDRVETEQLHSQTEGTISQLRAQAEARTPLLVEEIMEVIWSQLLPPKTQSGPRP
jgi:hypothetical protein